MNGKVTIIIPVYNTKQYLEECVNSVTGQTYRNLEILLIDDGSTDGSAELCDELARRDSRVRVLHKENGGVASARNSGIDEAIGKYVMFLDSDDWLSKEAIEELVSHADEHETDVIRFNYIREFNERSLIKQNTILEERIYTEDECKTIARQTMGLVGAELANPENMNFLASCWTNMYRKSFLVNSGVRFTDIWEIGSFEDGLFNLCVYMKMHSFEYIERAFYHYRKDNVSETSGYRKAYGAKRLVLAKKLKEIVEQAEMWPFFEEAYNNRMVHATIEISFNALRNPAPFSVKYKEIKSVLTHEVFTDAYKKFSLKYLDLKWKIYFFFIKHSMVLPTYVMTAMILRIKNRGVR